MFSAGPITVGTPVAALAALALSVVAIAVAVRRRAALPGASGALVAVGLLLMSVAAGSPVLERPDADEVVVMVDLSPSTRGARYRDAGFLKQRVGQLLGGTRYRTVYFA